MSEKKHFCLKLHFTIDIDKDAIPDAPSEGYDHYQHQKRLLQTLLSSKEDLSAFLRCQIAGHIECMQWQEWYALLLGKEDSDIKDSLAPSIATLEQSDQRYFQKAEGEGWFYESIEELGNCFSTELTTIEVVESEGDA